MTPDRLLAHYDRIADAPDAIFRMRRFVLDLAVRGKLVAQDADEELASVLLKRILAEKVRLRKLGEIRADNAVDPGGKISPPFVLPAGWAWSEIGQICAKTGSGSTPRGGKETYVSDGVIFLRSQNVHDDGLRLDDVVLIDHATHERMSGTAVRPGDLLLNITGGSIGRCCQVPADLPSANVSQHVAILRVAVPGIGAFLHRLILSPYFQAFVIGEQTGAGRGGLPKNRMDRIPVALPPLAEQHRIVAKVDELMALCDRLEAGRVAREAARDRLAAASLARLNSPDPNPATFTPHARFALDTLPALTTRPDQIKALRQTILNLAVRGKLVPQEPNDEPASRLLTRISAEVKTYSAANRISVGASRPVAEHEFPLEAPVGWAWTRLRKLALVVTDGDHQPPPRSEEGVAFLTIGNVTKGTIDFAGCRLVPPEYFKAIQAYRTPRQGDILYTVVGATYGRPVFVDSSREFCVQRHIAILKPAPSMDTHYLMTLLGSPFIYDQATKGITGAAQPTLGLGPLRDFLVPVPPLAEQHRIVAAVEKLMSLCDRLEAALTTGDVTRRRLLDALLQEALASPGAELDTAA